MTASPKSTSEGHDVVFTISSMHGPVDHDVTVFYTLSGSARDGSDYTISPTPDGQVVIPTGQQSTTVTMHVLVDGISENKETATLTLTSNPNYTITLKLKKATFTVIKNRT